MSEVLARTDAVSQQTRPDRAELFAFVTDARATRTQIVGAVDLIVQVLQLFRH